MSSTDGERRPLVSRRISAGRPKWKTQAACAAILLTEAFERIAFYALVGNLVLFLNIAPLQWALNSASNALLFFTGLSYTTAIVGGWIADSYLGRFKTIVLSFVIYILGYAFLPFFYPYPSSDMDTTKAPEWCAGSNSNSNNSKHDTSTIMIFLPEYSNISHISDNTGQLWPTLKPANSGDDMTCGWAVFLALGIIGLGNGAVKANIAPFGADQLRTEGPNRGKMMRAFFNWFYWCVNISSFISLGAIGYIQQEKSFFWGFIIPSVSLVTALVTFIVGGMWYLQMPPVGSLLSNIFRVLAEACRSRKRNRSGSDLEEHVELSPPSCLDKAKVRYGGSFHDNIVDDVKVVGRILLVFLALVPYWIVYFQMETTFVAQGLHMRLDFNKENITVQTPTDDKFQVPAVWLSLFDVTFLIILLPIMDRLVYPCLDRRGYNLSLRARMVIGMLFSFVSVCLAGGLEMYRLSVYWRNNTENMYPQIIGNTVYRAADVSILWQIPQYGLIGISEVFASVAGLELAYSAAPRSLQGVMMGFFWFGQGLGSMFGTLILSAFRGVWFFGWDHGDINCHNRPCAYDAKKLCDCHLDYYFFVLAGVQVLGLIMFIIVAWKLDIGSNRMRLERRRTERQNSRLSASSIDTLPPVRNSVRSPNHTQTRPTSRVASDSSISSESSLIAA